MALSDSSTWADSVREAFNRYHPDLRLVVADKWLRARTRLDPEKLLDRLLDSLDNAPHLDRRLKVLEPPERSLLVLLGMSRKTVWQLGPLMQLFACLADDVATKLVELLNSGFLYCQSSGNGSIQSFTAWLVRSTSPVRANLLVPPRLAERALATNWDLPNVPPATTLVKGAHEADGLEFPLRLGVVWQQIKAAPIRLTQSGELFRRDRDRLVSSALLAGVDSFANLPDADVFFLLLGQSCGLWQSHEGQIVAASHFPDVWDEGLGATLNVLWAAVNGTTQWNETEGWLGPEPTVTPYPAARLLCLAILARLEPDQWLTPEQLGIWLVDHHPFWNDLEEPPQLEGWVQNFLQGIAFPLRLVESATDTERQSVYRLSAWGRGILGLADLPAEQVYPRTLFVQPNLEVMAYRQGITPALSARLMSFADCKAVSPACVFQLQPDSVYRGLETGRTLQDILGTLRKHSERDLPETVLQALQTWADKRERLTIYTSAALLEFGTADDLQAALGRGHPGIRISDRLLLVEREADIDYRQFRLAGTRDYTNDPERCVEVNSDGVTLQVDIARSDLMLETELENFADLCNVVHSETQNCRVYRMTPSSLSRSRERGWTVRSLAAWFERRTNQSLPPAARLLAGGIAAEPLQVQRRLIVQVTLPILADALVQWPVTNQLIAQRLGPTTLEVELDKLGDLKSSLAEIGFSLESIGLQE